MGSIWYNMMKYLGHKAVSARCVRKKKQQEMEEAARYVSLPWITVTKPIVSVDCYVIDAII